MPRAPRAARPHATDAATPYVKGKGNEKGKGKHKGINLTVLDDDFSTPNIRHGSKRKRSPDDVLPANVSSSSKRKRSASPFSDTTVPESSDADDEGTGTLNYRNKRHPHKETAPMTPVKLKEWWAYKRPPTPRPPRRAPSEPPIPDAETAEAMDSPIEDFSDEEMDESCFPESQPPGWLDWQEVSPIRPWKPEPERRPWKPEIVHRRCSPGPRLQCAAIFASQPRDSYSQPSDYTEPEPTQRSEDMDAHSLFLMSQPTRPVEELTLQPMSQPSGLAEELGLRELMSQPTGLPEMLSLDAMSELSEDSEEPASQRSELADSEEPVMAMFRRSEPTDPEEIEVPMSQRTELADPEEEESMSQYSEPAWEQTKLSRDLFAYAIRHKLDTEKKPCHPNHVKDPVKRAKILSWHDQYHYKYRRECDIGKVKMDFEYQFHPDDMTVSLASRNLLAEAIEEDRGIRFGFTNDGEE